MDEAAAFQRMRDDLPEEERKGNMGKILNYVVELCQSGWSFRQALKNVGEICTLREHIDTIEALLGKMTEDGKEAILRAVDYQKKNASDALLQHYWDQLGCSLPELYENVAEDKITDHQKTRDAILNAIKDFQKKESNRVITDMVYGSAFVAVFQCVKLFMAWKTMSIASNLINSNPNDFTVINSKLQKMEQMVTELVDLCERDPNNCTIPLKMGQINTLFNSTLSNISDLRIKIDGQIQRVDLMADYVTVDGVANLVSAGTQGLQLLQTWNNATSFAKGMAFASIVAFTGLAAASAGVYVLSQDTLKQLRRDLNEAVRLQNTLQDLFEKAEVVFNEIARNA
ncbi:uncharacterized protein [Acropora muricata]|uniref:uncharacterized protein n=1 Tax=Acropora muricata TaxID=159855 RepID=UPI0034E3CA5B